MTRREVSGIGTGIRALRVQQGKTKAIRHECCVKQTAACQMNLSFQIGKQTGCDRIITNSWTLINCQLITGFLERPKWSSTLFLSNQMIEKTTSNLKIAVCNMKCGRIHLGVFWSAPFSFRQQLGILLKPGDSEHFRKVIGQCLITTFCKRFSKKFLLVVLALLGGTKLNLAIVTLQIEKRLQRNREQTDQPSILRDLQQSL